MKQILVVNGYPRSGKDTLALLLGKYKEVQVFSSVDPIKEVALTLGWDGNKDEAGRKFLASLKKCCVEYDDLPLKWLLDKCTTFKSGSAEVLVLFVRESEEIQKLRQKVNIVTVFVTNNRVKNVVSNPSDANISTDGYDIYLDNNGTLEDFEAEIKSKVVEVLF